MIERLAVLDIGSNSFHLLVADVDPSGDIRPVLREREMLHLGEVVGRSGGHLPEPAWRDAVQVAARLARTAKSSGAVRVRAVATGALRDADNGGHVAAEMSSAAGIDIRILSGAEEARFSYLGARACTAPAADPLLVLDLGGGSLELALGTAAQPTWVASTRLGVSLLSARVDHDPPKKREVADLRRLVAEELRPCLSALERHRPASVVAVGGPVRALAQIIASAPGRWIPNSLNQYRIDLDDLQSWTQRLLRLRLEERLKLRGMKTRRADRVHLAALVVNETLEHIGLDHLRVGTWGLREGVLLDGLGHPGPTVWGDRRRADVERLRRTFLDGDRHAAHVTSLAVGLFDITAPVHGLGDRDRELLQLAGLLHDIGRAVEFRRRWSHGAYLVEHAELRGIAPWERAVLACLVRFGDGEPSLSYPPYFSLSRHDRRRVDRLLPLLQLADALDGRRDGAVRDLRGTSDESTVRLDLVGDDLGAFATDLRPAIDRFGRTLARDMVVETVDGG